MIGQTVSQRLAAAAVAGVDALTAYLTLTFTASRESVDHRRLASHRRYDGQFL